MSSVNAEIHNDIQDELKSSIGMTVILVSLMMFFGTLFFGYAVYRFTTETWPPMGMQKINLMLPSMTTIAVSLGSLFFEISKKYLNKNNKIQGKNFLILSIVMGLSYVFFQYLLWRSMGQLGLYTSTGIFASLIYAFTWIHVAHMSMALILFFWAYIALLPREINKKMLRSFTNIGTFWHFLSGIWFFIFIFLFVL